MALLYGHDAMATAIDSGRVMLLTLLKLSSAFDMVDHIILLP
jgi:hypothetical protein